MPGSIRDIPSPRRANYFPSPSGGWQDEVIYFLLPDRFSDGNEASRPLLPRNDLVSARGPAWNWKKWSDSGKSRWQGGTLKGIQSKLPYCKNLGATTLWIGPVFKQRRVLDTFHGYSIQDFLQIDPHFGSTQDLIDLVNAAHALGIRIILDIVFHHSGNNWAYGQGSNTPSYLPYPAQYLFGQWRDADGQARLARPLGPDDGVWPAELQDGDAYMRAGQTNDLGNGPDDPVNDGTLPYRRTDFPPDGLRTFNLSHADTLANLALCYKYWLALVDCDGFRLDTVKHVTADVAQSFCGAVKEFADGLGKHDFFMVAEVGGGDAFEQAYLDSISGLRLDAALEIGEIRLILRDVARGFKSPAELFERLNIDTRDSHRNIAASLVSIVDDHDNTNVDVKLRFEASTSTTSGSGASTDHQVVAGTALQLFGLSIPCIYYGTEQAFGFNGPEPDQVGYLLAEGWRSDDHFLREAMFGPRFPCKPGAEGLGQDPSLPGFGPFGTAGFHCFDETHPAFVRIQHLTSVRRLFATLRRGRLYQRPLAAFGWSTDYPGGELVAWSRILDDREALCVVNSHGTQSRGARILVDYQLNPPGTAMVVIANTEEAAARAAGVVYTGKHPKGSSIQVGQDGSSGPAFVEIQAIGPSETLIVAAANLL